jgi:hypothetical protein
MFPALSEKAGSLCGNHYPLNSVHNSASFGRDGQASGLFFKNLTAQSVRLYCKVRGTRIFLRLDFTK